MHNDIVLRCISARHLVRYSGLFVANDYREGFISSRKKVYLLLKADFAVFFLRVSGGSHKIHKVLKPFSVVIVGGTAGLPGGSEGGGCYNRRLYDWPTAPQRPRCIWVYLRCPSDTGMYQSGRCQFLVHSVLPTDYGAALSQTGDKRQGWPKTGPVAWHFPMPRSPWLQDIEAGVD